MQISIGKRSTEKAAFALAKKARKERQHKFKTRTVRICNVEVKYFPETLQYGEHWLVLADEIGEIDDLSKGVVGTVLARDFYTDAMTRERAQDPKEQAFVALLKEARTAGHIPLSQGHSAECCRCGASTAADLRAKCP